MLSEPSARLPEEVCFSLPETRAILSLLDDRPEEEPWRARHD
jgi:hypothetical protein